MDHEPVFPEGASTWTRIRLAAEWLANKMRADTVPAQPPVPAQRPAHLPSTAAGSPPQVPFPRERSLADIEAEASRRHHAEVRQQRLSANSSDDHWWVIPPPYGMTEASFRREHPFAYELWKVNNYIDPRNFVRMAIGPEEFAALPTVPRNLNELAGLANIGLEWFSPAGDVLDMYQGGEMFARGIRELDPWQILGGVATPAAAFVGVVTPGRPGHAVRSYFASRASNASRRAAPEFSPDVDAHHSATMPERRLASNYRVLHNPQPLEARPFRDDYPDGAPGLIGTPLARNIDGEALRAPFVAGRRRVGGNDEGLSPEEIAEVAKRLGGVIWEAGMKELPEGWLGSYNSGTKVILYHPSLDPEERTNVIAHEVGHLLDFDVGNIFSHGAEFDFRRVFHDLRTAPGVESEVVTGPEHYGYSHEMADYELAAELLRAYMVDPNYVKTMAPKAAERVRAFVDTTPHVRKVIQFNNLAALVGSGVPAALAASWLYDDGDQSHGM